MQSGFGALLGKQNRTFENGPAGAAVRSMGVSIVPGLPARMSSRITTLSPLVSSVDSMTVYLHWTNALSSSCC